MRNWYSWLIFFFKNKYEIFILDLKTNFNCIKNKITNVDLYLKFNNNILAQLFKLNTNILHNFYFLRSKLNYLNSLELFLTSYYIDIEYLSLRLFAAFEMVFVPNGYFLIRDSIWDKWYKFCTFYCKLTHLSLFVWAGFPTTLLYKNIKLIFNYLLNKLIIKPLILIKEGIIQYKTWANILAYWLFMFLITFILSRLAVLHYLSRFSIDLITNILTWRMFSIIGWFIPAIIPGIIKKLIVLQNAGSEPLNVKDHVSIFSIERLNTISDTAKFPLSKQIDRVTNPSYDLDFTSSTDLEDGLVIVGEVSELGFQEVTHWIDWTTGLTTLTAITVSFLTIKAIAGRRWKK